MQNTNHAKSKALEYIYIYKIKLKKIIKVDPCPSDIQSWTWTTTQVNSNQPFYHKSTIILSSTIATSLTMLYATLFKCTYYYFLFIYLFLLNKKKKWHPTSHESNGYHVRYHYGGAFSEIILHLLKNSVFFFIIIYCLANFY